MALDRGWRFIFRCAIAGFLIAALAGLSPFVHAPSIIRIPLGLFSPGIWFFPEITLSSGAPVFSLAFGAVANGVLFTILGAIIVGVRGEPKS
jgi:hypothetical protein